MFKRILVCTDGSPLSAKAETVAIDLAASLGASLTGFHAVEDYPYDDNWAEYAVANSLISIAEWRADRITRAKRILRLLKEKAGKSGVTCDTRYVSNADPHAAILDAARKKRCDLIVMASHGRRGMDRWLLGSVANKVLTHGGLPVLIVR